MRTSLYIVAPKFVDRAGDYWANKKMVPIAGILALVAGLYLVWFGYLS